MGGISTADLQIKCKKNTLKIAIKFNLDVHCEKYLFIGSVFNMMFPVSLFERLSND